MEQNLREYQQSVTQGDRRTATHLDSTFHALVGEASKNRYLQTTYHQLFRRARFYFIRLIPCQNIVLNF